MVNVIIADDHQVVRQALAETLQLKGGFTIMAEATDGQELLELLKTHKPDVVVLDISMPRLDGLAVLEKLREWQSPPPVLVLSANEGGKSVRAVLKAGAKGFVPKNASVQELEFAIHSVMSGKTYLSPTVVGSLMTGEGSEVSTDTPLAVLTKREIEIMKYLADGKPNREIGKLLHISTRTVDTHRSNILKKLKLKTNAELVKLAISNGLITI